jgi:mannose-6-phosphate isomerase-like protein (cupin superfamily)
MCIFVHDDHGRSIILEMKMSRKVEKAWGHEDRWAITDKYLGKILYINEGHRLSKQYHIEKDETVYVLKGSLLLELGPHYEYSDTESGIKIVLGEGECQRIRPGLIHRFCADKGDVVLIEVSTAEIDDVVRLQDDYGR